MARKLAYTVHVIEKQPIDPERPELGDTVTRQETFLAGTEGLPKWARSLVGDHVYEEGSEADESESEDGETAGAEAPAGNASLEAWQEFARSRPGVTDEDIEGKSRNELREQFGA